MKTSTAARIAWREGRASTGKFLFVILAVAAGVGCLTGVRGFSRVFHSMLLKEARTLMAADLMVRVFSLPSPAQTAAIDALAKRGIDHTWITETITMLSAGAGDTPPVLISAKAVDTAKYPFYGQVKLNPPGRLQERLKGDTVAVSNDLLIRLNLQTGDTVRIGGQPYRIAGVVESEPDRMSGSLNVGPRILMTRQALERSGLMIAGSRASERFLFHVPPSLKIEEVRAEIKKAFPEGMVTDFTQTHPLIEQGLDRATTFLSLVSLIALIVGALGVSMAMQAHLQQRMDSIAVMKCLGARSGQIMKIYVLQTIGLGLAGGVLGVVAGSAVQAAFPLLIARYFHIATPFLVDAISGLQGLCIGVLATLLFTIPPLLSIRNIRPGAIFRRDVAEPVTSWSVRLRSSLVPALSALLILAGIAGIGAWLSDSLRLGLYFVGAIAFSLLVMSGLAWLLLFTLRRIGRSARGLPMSVRQGIANLYRPGNHAQAALVALGVGVTFTLTIYLVQRGMLFDMNRSAPPGMPNVFLLDITPPNRDAVRDLLSRQVGVAGVPDLLGTVAARIASVNGVALKREELKGMARRLASTNSVAESPALPVSTRLVQGHWWPAAYAGPPLLSISEEAAKILNVAPGSKIVWSTPLRTFESTVAAVHRTEAIRLSSRVEFIFSPGALNGLPMIYYASVRVRPPDVAQLQKAVYRRFPTVTVVNVADVLQIIQEVVNQISLVVRFISAFAILSGAIILASSVAGTRFRRIREVVILKTLGGTRGKIAAIFSMEFLILGCVAGVAGSLLAAGFAALVVKRIFNADPQFDWVPLAVCVLGTGIIANLAGWLASFRILQQRPLEILRNE